MMTVADRDRRRARPRAFRALGPPACGRGATRTTRRSSNPGSRRARCSAAVVEGAAMTAPPNASMSIRGSVAKSERAFPGNAARGIRALTALRRRAPGFQGQGAVKDEAGVLVRPSPRGSGCQRLSRSPAACAARSPRRMRRALDPVLFLARGPHRDDGAEEQEPSCQADRGNLRKVLGVTIHPQRSP